MELDPAPFGITRTLGYKKTKGEPRNFRYDKPARHPGKDERSVDRDKS